MDVTGEHGVGVGQQLGHVIAEQDLALAVLPADELGVKVDIVDARERMQDVPELLAELLHRQDIAVGVNPGPVQTLPVHQMVAHLVRRVREQQHDLFAACRDPAQQNGKAVAAQNGEGHAHRAAAGLCPHVFGDLPDAGIVALGTGDDRLGHGHDVPVAGLNACFFPGRLHGVRGDAGNVVSLTDNGCAHAAHNGSDGSHKLRLLCRFGIF